jgi:hypothetical protein
MFSDICIHDIQRTVFRDEFIGKLCAVSYHNHIVGHYK